MSFIELFLLAVSLSMDAFAVAVCKGLAMKKLNRKGMVIVGAWFGSFQFLMPLLGYVLARQFSSYITRFDHWIAFILLVIIGIQMIRDAFSPSEEVSEDLSVKNMFLMAVATSIDALAVGITFAFLNVSVLPASAMIGLTTFLLSAVGVKVGHTFGTRYKSRAELTGGILLILLGLKILLEHLGILVI